MARKNPFADLMNEPVPAVVPGLAARAPRGAGKNMLGAIADLAQQADRLLEGATVVDLDVDLIDGSFVRDRMEEIDLEEYAQLRDAIRARGQDSPILVRPHPSLHGRYMIVFGHRRYRVAKELGLKIRAVVKDLKDIDHVLAQGQENSARANLSYVEKAIYAGNLAALHLDEDNSFILSALSIDASALSSMLSVASLPSAVLEAIGPARKIGRPRWLSLRKLLDRPANLELAKSIVAEDGFASLSSDDRFAALLSKIQSSNSKRAVAKSAPRKRQWEPKDRTVLAALTADDRRFNLAIKGDDAETRGFGDFVVDRLEALYTEFRKEKTETNMGS